MSWTTFQVFFPFWAVHNDHETKDLLPVRLNLISHRWLLRDKPLSDATSDSLVLIRTLPICPALPIPPRYNRVVTVYKTLGIANASNFLFWRIKTPNRDCLSIVIWTTRALKDQSIYNFVVNCYLLRICCCWYLKRNSMTLTIWTDSDDLHGDLTLTGNQLPK